MASGNCLVTYTANVYTQFYAIFEDKSIQVTFLNDILLPLNKAMKNVSFSVIVYCVYQGVSNMGSKCNIM